MWNINYDTKMNQSYGNMKKDLHRDDWWFMEDRFGNLGFTDANCYVYN